LHLLSL